MNKGINVLSLFDGISCGRLALERAGIQVNSYYASEIKKSAIKCSKANWDDIIQIGDVTKVSYSNGTLKTENGDFEVQIDLLIGGSPCQDFSIANPKITGLNGTKSSLFYEYLRILQETKPKYFLLENVKMKQEHENQLSGFLSVSPVKINSKLFSGCLRNRLYWTNIPIQPIQDANISMQSILESGYTPKKKGYCLMEGDSRPHSTPYRIFHRWYGKSFDNIVFENEYHYLECKEHYDMNFNGLSASKITQKIKDTHMDISIYDNIRYVSKVERCRLQTLPDNYCNVLSNNEAAGVIGDGWTVDVIAHIFKSLNNKNGK